MNDKLPPSLSRFGAELERAIKRELELVPRASRVWRSRPRALAGMSAGLAAIGTSIALVLSAASSSPAFAITHNHDGSVSVRVMRLEGVAAANARLAALNIHARLVQVTVGCGRPPFAPSGALKATLGQTRVDPAKIPTGRTLVIAVMRAGREVRVARGHAVAGLVPACLPPLPPPCLLKNGKLVPGPWSARVRKGQVLAPPHPSRTTGNSGNSGSPGNSGTAGSGNSGNSGTTIDLGNSGTTTLRSPLRQVVASCKPAFHSGNSGNSGNSGTAGNSGASGNSGTAGKG